MSELEKIQDRGEYTFPGDVSRDLPSIRCVWSISSEPWSDGVNLVAEFSEVGLEGNDSAIKQFSIRFELDAVQKDPTIVYRTMEGEALALHHIERRRKHAIHQLTDYLHRVDVGRK